LTVDSEAVMRYSIVALARLAVQTLQQIPASIATPVTVTNGGTGDATLTAHAVLVGEGASPVATTGPGAVGVPLIGAGAGADPSFGTATVPGGGTGVVTIPAHAVVLGEGTSPVATAAPGVAGTVLTSNGVAADPTFQAPSSGGLVSTAFTSNNTTHSLTTGASTVIATLPVTIAAGQKLRVWGVTNFTWPGGTAADSAELTVFVDGIVALDGQGAAFIVTTSGTGQAVPTFGEVSGLSVGAHTVTLEAQMLSGTNGHASISGGTKLMTDVVSV
jgi:hypothetical protein